jgi:hypothetical protein
MKVNKKTERGNRMDDEGYYYEMNKCINAVESFFDVLRVILKHDLFWEIKGSSMSYLFNRSFFKIFQFVLGSDCYILNP